MLCFEKLTIKDIEAILVDIYLKTERKQITDILSLISEIEHQMTSFCSIKNINEGVYDEKVI
jgi:hypothetical protein